MKSFEQFIIEGRDAPLYHGTDVKSVLKMIEGNRILGHHGGHMDYTISTSRNIHYAKFHSKEKWGSWEGNVHDEDIIVLELDQASIARSYKIFPYNAWGHDTYSKARVAKKEIGAGLRPNEYEEVIVAESIPFERYVKKIIMFVKPDKLKFNKILAHPKLYYNGKFVNK